MQTLLSVIDAKLNAICQYLGLSTDGRWEENAQIGQVFVRESVFRKERKLSKPLMRQIRKQLHIGLRVGKNIVYSPQEIQSITLELERRHKEKEQRMRNRFY